MKLAALLAAVTFPAFTFSVAANAQTKQVDHYSSAELSERAQALRTKPDPATGNPQSTLAKYPNHYTMLILRDKSGQSELHEHTADVFVVLDGSAELLTGGRMVGAKQTDKDESRGTGVESAVAAPLKKGDIVHIPAGVPHQVRVLPGKTLTYFVVKVSESD